MRCHQSLLPSVVPNRHQVPYMHIEGSEVTSATNDNGPWLVPDWWVRIMSIQEGLTESEVCAKYGVVRMADGVA